MIYLQGEDAIQFHTEGTAIALGKFDGIHIGHQMLVEGLQKEKQHGRQAVVFTFGNVPNTVLKGRFQKNIYAPDEKIMYFQELGVDILLDYPFTREFAALSPEEFVTECLVNALGVRAVYVGEDYHFGCGRSGNVALLKALGEQHHFDVHAIQKKTLHGKVVSSTTIRDMLETHFYIANEMLGNPYFVYGQVVHGKNLGHTIGFPTMNQLIPEQKLLPAYGVYASRVMIDGVMYRGISNLGQKPTVEGVHQVGLETHLLDYAGDLYGRYLKTELLYFIRPEEKFSGMDKLTRQIQNDVQYMLEQEKKQ